jgi:hypothetical protein
VLWLTSHQFIRLIMLTAYLLCHALINLDPIHLPQFSRYYRARTFKTPLFRSVNLVIGPPCRLPLSKTIEGQYTVMLQQRTFHLVGLIRLSTILVTSLAPVSLTIPRSTVSIFILTAHPTHVRRGPHQATSPSRYLKSHLLHTTTMRIPLHILLEHGRYLTPTWWKSVVDTAELWTSKESALSRLVYNREYIP